MSNVPRLPVVPELALRLAVVAPALAALTALTGCNLILGVEPDPVLVPTGSTGSGPSTQCKGTLRVRITTDNSGTAQDIAKPYNQAVYDYMRELKATGGLRGCDVDADLQDGGYDATTTQNVVTTWSKK